MSMVLLSRLTTQPSCQSFRPSRWRGYLFTSNNLRFMARNSPDPPRAAGTRCFVRSWDPLVPLPDTPPKSGRRPGARLHRMSVEEHRKRAPAQLGFGFLTISDSRRPANDGSGARLRELATAAGHRIERAGLVPDEP